MAHGVVAAPLPATLMARRSGGAVALTLMWMGLACAADSPSTPPVPPAAPLYEAPTLADRIGRILVPIMVNNQGPFQFVLDTGANRSVLTPHLVAALGLKIAVNATATMSGVTGSSSVPTVAVEQIKAGEVVLRRQRLPVADGLSKDTDGTLGVDALGDTRILVDFVHDTIRIRSAQHEGVPDNVIRIPGQCRFGRLLVVKASVGRIPVKAVIDTGSQHTLANFTLRNKLGLPTASTASTSVQVIGETLAQQPGDRRRVPVIRMGRVQMIDPTVVFGDFYVFRLWGLDAEPAIVLGMDMIGTLDTLLIDYQRCEIQVRARANLFQNR
jgi:hypothetical protein